MIVLVAVILVLFWKTQENKFYIIELSLPFVLFAAFFYVVAFVALGKGQLGSPSIFRVISSATEVVCVFSLLVLVVFLFLPKHPEEAEILNPGSIEIARGILLNISIPLWVAYAAGGLAQFLLITRGANQ